jgi:hypothetical protein
VVVGIRLDRTPSPHRPTVSVQTNDGVARTGRTPERSPGYGSGPPLPSTMMAEMPLAIPAPHPAASVDELHLERRSLRELDGPLHDELVALITPTYVDAPAFMEEEYRKNDRIYLLRDAAGALAAFFLVGWQRMELDGVERQTVFLGLSAARETGRGLARQLYAAFNADARAWQAQHGERILVWFTTATPIVCGVAWRIFSETEPRPDGTFSAKTAATARQVLRTRDLERKLDAAHPFVLRGAATTRYSASELTRIAAVDYEPAGALLSRLTIDERRGDRILFLAHVPPT